MSPPSVFLVLVVWFIVYFAHALFGQDASQNGYTGRVQWARHGDVTSQQYFQLYFSNGQGGILIAGSDAVPVIRQLKVLDGRRVKLTIEALPDGLQELKK